MVRAIVDSVIRRAARAPSQLEVCLAAQLELRIHRRLRSESVEAFARQANLDLRDDLDDGRRLRPARRVIWNS